MNREVVDPSVIIIHVGDLVLRTTYASSSGRLSTDLLCADKILQPGTCYPSLLMTNIDFSEMTERWNQPTEFSKNTLSDAIIHPALNYHQFSLADFTETTY